MSESLNPSPSSKNPAVLLSSSSDICFSLSKLPFLSSVSPSPRPSLNDGDFNGDVLRGPHPRCLWLSEVFKDDPRFEGALFSDVPIPEKLGEMFRESFVINDMPLYTIPEIANDEKKAHQASAKVILCAAESKFRIFAMMLNMLEKKEGNDPPDLLLNLEEKITGDVGGKI